MRKYLTSFFIMLIFSVSSMCIAEDRLELETTFIKGNKDMPQILYVVPWQDIKKSKSEEQNIVLHSLFGDLFDPVNPSIENTFTVSDSKPR
ncbi:MAG: hypothetical protein OEZ33_00475 [Gammaproteobacteria bacterium]|nr:hypothetical protein [Gammaproteobacteria bacterium]MDH5776654.1 hypothetical protein [Gammaproteobacteria bacterium]